MQYLKNYGTMLMASSLLAVHVIANPTSVSPGFSLAKIIESLKAFIASRPFSILTMALISWYILYTLFRVVLEQGGRSTEAYSHAIAVVVSVILASSWTIAYISNPEIKGFFRAALTGWAGLSVTIFATIVILCTSYYTINKWSQSSVPPSP